MGHFEDANSLVKKSVLDLEGLKAAYEQSLSQQFVSPELLIDIKNLMENLRSALDYAAHGLFTSYGCSAKVDPKVYFPYAIASQSLTDFRNANRIESCIPGIVATRPDIVLKLEGYQHFSGKQWRWVPMFMALNNSNKHQQLTPQIRRQTRELRMTFPGGATISMAEGARIVIGSGASIASSGGLIRGGQEISVDKPPVMTGGGKSEVLAWVSFHFASNGEAVIPFLVECVDGAKQIVSELKII